MDLYNEKEYNHLSIFLFLIPLGYSVYLECELYTAINLIWLVSGFSYHFMYFISDRFTDTVYLFRYIDMLAVHTLIPYIIYHSTYHNYYYYTAMASVFLLIALFYFKVVEVKHSTIHVIASFGVFNAVNSCHLHKDTCTLCQ
jgi:hypothetical protein